MKLATFQAPGVDKPFAGVVADDRIRPFADGVTVLDALADGGEPPVDETEGWGLSEVELLAPVPAPGTIFAIGLNYAAHVAETGAQAPE